MTCRNFLKPANENFSNRKKSALAGITLDLVGLTGRRRSCQRKRYDGSEANEM